MSMIPHSLAASSWTDHVIRYVNRGIRDRHHSRGLKGAEPERISARTAVADEKVSVMLGLHVTRPESRDILTRHAGEG